MYPISLLVSNNPFDPYASLIGSSQFSLELNLKSASDESTRELMSAYIEVWGHFYWGRVSCTCASSLPLSPSVFLNKPTIGQYIQWLFC